MISSFKFKLFFLVLQSDSKFHSVNRIQNEKLVDECCPYHNSERGYTKKRNMTTIHEEILKEIKVRTNKEIKV